MWTTPAGTGDPNYVPQKSDLAGDYASIGTFQIATGKAQMALESLEKGLQLREGLAEAAPYNPLAQRELVEILEKLGAAHKALATEESRPRMERLGHFRSSRAMFQRALDILLDMRERGLLAESDAGLPGAITDAIAECDAAIAALEAGAEPVTGTKARREAPPP